MMDPSADQKTPALILLGGERHKGQRTFLGLVQEQLDVDTRTRKELRRG